MGIRASSRVLITGAAGFVGFHVAQRLLAEGAAVHGIDNLNAYYDTRLKEARLARLQSRGAFSFERIDITDYDRVRQAFDTFKPVAVVHFAAQAGVRYSIQQPRAYVSANMDGFLAILEACRAVPIQHLLYASSSSVYGANGKVPFSEHDNANHPVSMYAATKRANELMAHSYAHLFGIRATGLRLFTAYGPWGRPDMAYFTFTRAILEGRPIEVYDGGAMRRDFTYIDDAVEAIIRLIERPAEPDPAFNPKNPSPAAATVPHRVYNIGNHTPVELERFIAVIEKALGRAAQKIVLPRPIADVPTTYADISDLAAAIGFAPNTQIEEGIPRFVEWYRRFYC